MEILCWEVSQYVVWLDDNTEYHFFSEESLLRFLESYSHKVTSVEKIMKGVVGK